jgi:hypothetical protein
MAERDYDIFLTFSPTDRSTAEVVAGRFESAGLSVFLGSVESGELLSDAILRELVAARALVVLLTPLGLRSINIGLDMGAALSWQKPVFVLSDGVSPSELPPLFRSHRVYPVAELDRVIRDVRQTMQPLTDDDRDALKELYGRLQIPTDQLISQPHQLDSFTRAFNRLRHSTYAGERLTQELLRMRKRGELPRLGRGGHAASA